MSDQYDVVIVGAGSAGISVAARLLNEPNPPSVAIIDPAKMHYYQPIWTLVGGGVFDREVSARPMESLIPDGASWIRDKVVAFDPEKNQVELSDKKRIGYQQLVVAAGIKLDWDQVKGLRDAMGKGGVCSNYSYETVNSTWEALRTFKSGNAVFTFPKNPFKCAGAPQKIMWLAEHYFEKQGIRDKCNVIYACAGGAIFGIPRYRDALQKLEKARNIDGRYQRNLIEVRPGSREAVFEHVGGQEKELVLKYDMLHVTPPQCAPDFIRKSALANDDGWVDVDKHTMVHTKYPNVFSLGDCSSLPCSKTGAAIRKQAPILVENLMATRNDRKPKGQYDGYASCPLVTGYGRLILAEFGYDGKIMETFPFAQNRERYSMYALKAYMLPDAYWHGMLRGRL